MERRVATIIYFDLQSIIKVNKYKVIVTYCAIGVKRPKDIKFYSWPLTHVDTDKDQSLSIVSQNKQLYILIANLQSTDLSTRAAKHQGCNWDMQMIDGCSL